MKAVVPEALGLSSIPSALLSFRSSSGSPRILAVAWVGVVCSRPAVLSVTLQRSLFPSGKVPRGGEFVINLPSEEQLASRSFLSTMARGEVPLSRGAGLSLEEAATIGAPLIAECPVRIECRHAAFFSRFGQDLISGEVAAVHMQGEIYGLDGPIDFCTLQPFTKSLSQARKSGFDGIVPQGLEAAALGSAPS